MASHHTRNFLFLFSVCERSAVCQFSEEEKNNKTAPSAVSPFAQRGKWKNKAAPPASLSSGSPPLACLQVAFAKVVPLISNIFGLRCERHYPGPRNTETRDVWSGQNYSGECGRGVVPPRGDQHALGWVRTGSCERAAHHL